VRSQSTPQIFRHGWFFATGGFTLLAARILSFHADRECDPSNGRWLPYGILPHEVLSAPPFTVVELYVFEVVQMAELGIASGVAGLISLGITLSKAILTYYEAYRGSTEEIDTTCASLSHIGKTLVVIDSTMAKRQFSKATVHVVESNVKACAHGLKCLAKKLDKIRSVPPDGTWQTKLTNARRKMSYPLKESTLAKLREICNEVEENLNLALGALNKWVLPVRYGAVYH